jgi:hypothetical protein
MSISIRQEEDNKWIVSMTEKWTFDSSEDIIFMHKIVEYLMHDCISFNYYYDEKTHLQVLIFCNTQIERANLDNIKTVICDLIDFKAKAVEAMNKRERKMLELRAQEEEFWYDSQ